MAYTKLFSEIIHSTIWAESVTTKIVWVTMLAMADDRGEVRASVPGLAKAAGVTLGECEVALKCFASPDEYSRSKEFEGRRIEEVDGGWLMLNHAKFRAIRSAEERREYKRKWTADKRKKDKPKPSKKPSVFKKPRLSDVIDYFKENGYTDDSAEKAFMYYEEANWHDAKGDKVKNWKQKMRGVWFKPENKKVNSADQLKGIV